MRELRTTWDVFHWWLEASEEARVEAEKMARKVRKASESSEKARGAV
jgi:hypothetical protein